MFLFTLLGVLTRKDFTLIVGYLALRLVQIDYGWSIVDCLVEGGLYMEMNDKEVKAGNEKVRGEAVYEKGDVQIMLDRESDKDAFWKMYNKTGRVGTFNKDLTIKLGK